MCIFVLSLILCVCVVSSQNLSARSFNSGCGQVFTDRDFIIESPGYPGNYPLNYKCSYLIKGPTCPTNFNFHFLDFTVESSPGCSKDRLEVDDKDALCGNKSNYIKNYFSEKGTLILRFVSDETVSGRGYRISITRSSCQAKSGSEITTQKVPKWHTTNRDVEYTTTTQRTFYNRNFGKCCQNFYNSYKFILTSPNFPNSLSTPVECLYEIHKANVNVCRLRIHVQFFWLGRTNNCQEGFLEIDGKHICGCRSNLKIIAPFEGQSTKILRFVSKGYERSSYSGFVMDVIQDECPKKVIPEVNVKEEKFRFYNDQINRVTWPNSSHEAVVEKLRLISENTEVLDDDKISFTGAQPKIVKHFYFYAYPEFGRNPTDREETEYLDTSSKTSLMEENYGYCRNWNQMQFNSLRNLPFCKTNQGSSEERKCIQIELKEQTGYFKSPGYPFYYPPYLNVCYRFHKLPGYCSIRVHMKDFRLEDSLNCEKDYLSFGNQLRYCGITLKNTISTLDLRSKSYEQMNFVTDGFYCSKGFFGAYEQIPCQEFPHPINPSTPSLPPMTPCSKVVQEETFTFEVYDYNQPSCSLTIKKYSEFVCSVTLYFERFDLACLSESLVIDGTLYCGRLSGQTVRINLTDQDSILVYRRSSSDGVNGLRLRIRGTQVSDDCPYPEVPAERLLNINSTDSIDFYNTNNTQFLLKFGDKFKSICGLVTNTTETKLPETFCDLIMKNNNNNLTNCLPLSENALIVPLESQKIELNIRGVKTTQEIEFQEVDCDDLSK